MGQGSQSEFLQIKPEASARDKGPVRYFILFCFLKKYLFIYLAAPGLSCGTRDL